MKFMWGAESVKLSKRFQKDTYHQGQTESGAKLSIRRDERGVFIVLARFEMHQGKFLSTDPQRAVDEAHEWFLSKRKGEAWMQEKSIRYQEQGFLRE